MADIKKETFHSEPKYICFDDLIKDLSHLQNIKFIFRGQQNIAWPLQPTAFREDGIRAMSELYTAAAPAHSEWPKSINCKNMAKLIRHDENAIYHADVIRLSELTIYILKYNYSLAKYVAEFPENFDEKTLNAYKIRDHHFWAREDAFEYFFRYQLENSTTRTSLDNKILKEGRIDDEITIYEESLPQHYDVPTAALDWSYDPSVALYFATNNASEEYFSIFAYKEINNNLGNPIEVVHGNPGCTNPRIKAQNGLFTRFRYPCKYYFLYHKWPTIDCYMKNRSHGNFELIKYDIPLIYINEINEILKMKNITKSSLCLDETNKINEALEILI